MQLSSITSAALGSSVNAPAHSPEIRAKPTIVLGTNSEMPPKAKPHSGEVEAAVKTLINFTAALAQDIHFSLDEETGRTVVKVINNTNGEILRQFPSEEALQIAQSLYKMQGLLIYEKA